MSKIKRTTKLWWTETASKFLASFLSGLALLFIGVFFAAPPIIKQIQSARVTLNNSPGANVTIGQALQQLNKQAFEYGVKQAAPKGLVPSKELISELTKLRKVSEDVMSIPGSSEFLNQPLISKVAGWDNVFVTSSSNFKNENTGLRDLIANSKQDSADKEIE